MKLERMELESQNFPTSLVFLQLQTDFPSFILSNFVSDFSIFKLSNFSFFQLPFPTTRIPDMDTGADKPRTVSSVELSNLSVDGIFLTDLSGVCSLSGFCPESLTGVCLSGFRLSRFCQLSGDSVWILETKTVRCLSARPGGPELSRLPLSLSADVWPQWDFARSLRNGSDFILDTVKSGRSSVKVDNQKLHDNQNDRDLWLKWPFISVLEI